MIITAYQKLYRMSPRKLRLVADSVRALHPTKALITLQFMHKRAALPLRKVLKQAVSNAIDNKFEEKNLKIKHILIEEGPSYKRFRAASRGRARMIQRKTSHIKIVLQAGPKKDIKKPVKQALKSEKKSKTEK